MKALSRMFIQVHKFRQTETRPVQAYLARNLAKSCPDRNTPPEKRGYDNWIPRRETPRSCQHLAI